MKCEKREYLNYTTYGVCGHTFSVSAYTGSLTLFLQLQKDHHSVHLLDFHSLELHVAQEQRKATEECDQKIHLIKEQRKLNQPNRALFRQFLQHT